jgi:hypothetical protein
LIPRLPLNGRRYCFVAPRVSAFATPAFAKDNGEVGDRRDFDHADGVDFNWGGCISDRDIGLKARGSAAALR